MTKTLTGYDLCQGVITKTYQTMSYLHKKFQNWANDT